MLFPECSQSTFPRTHPSKHPRVCFSQSALVRCSSTAPQSARVYRFYFMKEINFGQDGDFSEERFRLTVNSALANDVGNLTNRSLTLLRKSCASTFPVAAAAAELDDPMRVAAAVALPRVEAAYRDLAFREAILAAQGISGRGNQLLEERQPWTALKKGTDDEKAEAAALLVSVLEGVRITALLLSPIVPDLAARIYSQLGLEGELQVRLRPARPTLLLTQAAISGCTYQYGLSGVPMRHSSRHT